MKYQWLKARAALRQVSQFLGRLAVHYSQVLRYLSWSTVRLVAVCVTVVAMLAIHFSPNQTQRLHFDANNHYMLFSDAERGGGSHATWLDDYSYSRFKCDMTGLPNTWCGYLIMWPHHPNGLQDFTHFHSLRVQLKYVGRAEKLRIYMRAYDPSYGSLTDAEANKFESVLVDVKDFSGVVTVPLSEFVVSDWWVQRYAIPRQQVALDFKAVQMLAIDFPQPGAPGEHVMEVQSIELVGEYIVKEHAYFMLLIAWMLVLLAEASYRYYRMNKRVEQVQARASTLANYARELRAQSSLYKKLSGVDPLTGIYNRAGIKPLLHKNFSNNRRAYTSALMVIDIDHFKKINDNLGHSVGDSVIKLVAQTMTDVIRIGDLFARWGGEEFLLLCPNADAATATFIGEKLRKSIEAIYFTDEPELQVTVSVGLTLFDQEDTFDVAFDRADKALYRAKRSGRNRVVISPKLELEPQP